MVRKLTLLAVLYILWLLLSGMPVPFLLAAGLGCSIAVLVFCGWLEAGSGDSVPAPLKWGRVLAYVPWLLKEIIVAAWEVSKRILHPKLPISPTLVDFKPMQKTDVGLVIHANSITLTPGTITVEVEPGRLLVHALTAEGAASLSGSGIDRRCAELEDL